MKVVNKSRARAEAQAAAILRERIAECADRAGRATMGVPGGRSVAGVLETLAGSDAPFDAVDLFFVDERCVPLESEESNFRVVRDALLDPPAGRKAAPPSDRIHPFICAEDEADLGVGAYEEEFRRAATHLDIALLGVGEDGHIASLFPGSPVLTESSRLFVPIDEAPKPPPRRMSASPALLTAPETMVVLLFFGEGKRNALKAFVSKEGSPTECPARLVKDMPDLWVFTDIGT
ncbi:MAG: 6-phosphogluconolactonase [Spirochaetes bacterium]|nr:6-phosphogluconolactonase [Spirochaetota bacterium]